MKYWINQWDKSDGCDCFRYGELNEVRHKKCNCHDKKKDDWDKKDNCKWISCRDVNICVVCKDEKEHKWDKKCDCCDKKRDNCKRIKCGDVTIYVVCKDNKKHDWDKKCDCHE